MMNKGIAFFRMFQISFVFLNGGKIRNFMTRSGIPPMFFYG